MSAIKGTAALFAGSAVTAGVLACVGDRFRRFVDYMLEAPEGAEMHPDGGPGPYWPDR